MKKGNILDIGFAAVKKSGRTNMFDAKSVQYWAFKLGFFELVTWIEENNTHNYLDYLNSIHFDVVQEVEDLEEIILFDDEMEARECIAQQFSQEIKDYKKANGFNKLKELPISFAEFKEAHIQKFTSVINDIVDDHEFNYYLNVNNNYILWFKDGLYVKEDATYKEVFQELTGTIWSRLLKLIRDEHSNGKVEQISEHMRLALLFE